GISILKTIALRKFLIIVLLLKYSRVNSVTIYCTINQSTTKLLTGIAYFILAKKINSDLRPGSIIDAITNIATKMSIPTVTTLPDAPTTLSPSQITPAAGIKKIRLPTKGGILNSSDKTSPLPDA